MRGRLFAVTLALLASGSLLAADIDLSDFDDDLMRSMDDSIKDLEPVIAAGNVQGAADDVKVLQDGFKWTEEYFTHKGNTADAVGFARKSEELTLAVQKALAAKDLAGAGAAARALSKSCRTCHDVYKPLTK